MRGEFGSASGQHLMLRDHVRVMGYRAALFAHARDRVVVDLGCGTGLLSILAVQAGAKHVYAIERGNIAGLARLMFKANGCEDRVTLFRQQSRSVELPEKADLLVHEILGTDPFVEDILPSVADARARLLVPGARLIPHRLEVCCVGVELAVPLPPGERILKEAAELGGLYGVNMEPYLMALGAHRDLIGMAPLDPRDRILTEECVLRNVDLEAEVSVDDVTVPMQVTAPGRLDAISLFFRAHLDDKLQISTSPFAPWTHWGHAIRELLPAARVEPGQSVQLKSRIEAFEGYQQVVVER